MGNCTSISKRERDEKYARRRRKRTPLQPFRDAAKKNPDRRERHQEMVAEYRNASLQLRATASLNASGISLLSGESTRESSFVGTAELMSGDASPTTESRIQSRAGNMRYSSNDLSAMIGIDGSMSPSTTLRRTPSVVFVVSPDLAETTRSLDNYASGSGFNSDNDDDDNDVTEPMDPGRPDTVSTKASPLVPTESLLITPHQQRSSIPPPAAVLPPTGAPSAQIIEKALALRSGDLGDDLDGSPKDEVPQVVWGADLGDAQSDQSGCGISASYCVRSVECSTQNGSNGNTNFGSSRGNSFHVQQMQRDSPLGVVSPPPLLPLDDSEERPWRGNIARRGYGRREFISFE